MAIESNCPSCGRRLRVADEHAGKRARCPHCGAIYEVPTATEPAQHPTAPAAEDRWRLKTSEGKVFGPVAKPELDSWFAQGRVTGEDRFQREGEQRWRPASELYPTLAAGAAAAKSANPFADVDSTARNPYSPPGGGLASVAAYRRPHRGPLILILGILGWAFCFVFSIFAWSMGSADLKEMRVGRMDESGRGLTTAGMVLGMIQVIVLCVFFGFILLMAVFSAIWS
jgi:hypothetical protein